MTETIKPVAFQRAMLLLLIFSLGAVFFAVRIENTQTLVTNDEPFWLGRSANFSRALSQWEPEHTYQMAHPGVTVMWSGAVAYWLYGSAYLDQFDTNLDRPFFIDDRLHVVGIDPLEMLQHARTVKLGFETALFVISIAMLSAVSTRLVTAIAGLLIALDPFLAGFGPLLHVDSLLAMSMFAASLAIVWASRNHQERWWPWLIAGALGAIAVLTRTTGVVIAVPLFVAAIMIWKQSGARASLQATGSWVVGFATLYVLAWPALWVQPVETARAMIDWTLGAASDGHEHQLFFRGAASFGDPGWLFYPVTMLWRTTPVVWIGLALFFFSLRSADVRARVRPLIPVLTMGAVYLLIMSTGAKKFDRYVLPAYPVVALMAALGFASTVAWLRSTFSNIARFVPALGLATIALLSLIPLSNAGPYRLNYYNEVMRVFERPENSIQIGWGEGAYEAIDFVRQEAERLGRPVTAQAFPVPSNRLPAPTRYFVVNHDGSLDAVTFTQVGLSTQADWNGTDYFLFNIQQTQRDMIPEYLLFADAEPVYIVELGGVAIWEIYAPSQLPLPDAIPTD